MTCSSTRRRMSVIAFCAATPRICDRPNDVTAWTSVARPTIQASRGKQSTRPLDDVVDQVLRGQRQDEPGHAVDQHQHQAERQAPAARPDEVARLLPGRGPANLLLAGLFGHACRGLRSRRGPRGPAPLLILSELVADLGSRFSPPGSLEVSCKAGYRLRQIYGESRRSASREAEAGLLPVTSCRNDPFEEARDRPRVHRTGIAVAQHDHAKLRRAMHERGRMIPGGRTAVAQHHRSPRRETMNPTP